MCTERQLVRLEAELKSTDQRQPEDGWPLHYVRSQEAGELATHWVLPETLETMLHPTYRAREDEAVAKHLLEIAGRFTIAASSNLGAAAEAAVLSKWDTTASEALVRAVLGNVLVTGQFYFLVCPLRLCKY